MAELAHVPRQTHNSASIDPALHHDWQLANSTQSAQGACEFYLKVHKSKHITLPYQFDIHERNFNHEVKRHGTYNEIGFIKRKLDKMPHGLQQGKV